MLCVFLEYCSFEWMKFFKNCQILYSHHIFKLKLKIRVKSIQGVFRLAKLQSSHSVAGVVEGFGFVFSPGASLCCSVGAVFPGLPPPTVAFEK